MGPAATGRKFPCGGTFIPKYALHVAGALSLWAIVYEKSQKSLRKCLGRSERDQSLPRKNGLAPRTWSCFSMLTHTVPWNGLSYQVAYLDEALSGAERGTCILLTNGVADPNLGISPFALLNHRWLDHFDFRRAWGTRGGCHPEKFRKRPWDKDEDSIILDSMDSIVCDNKDQPGANQWARISKQLLGRYLYHSL